MKDTTVTYAEYIDICQRRLLAAIEQYKPPFIWVAYSGGGDSALVLDIVRKIDTVNVPWGVMTIDTGLSSPGHIDRIIDDCSQIGITPHVFTGSGLEWWVDNVRSYGYAYTPNQHVIYYRELKERAIDQSIREVKTRYHQKIISITGVRRAESYKRAKTEFIYATRSSRVTLNMIADLSDESKHMYMENVDWWHGRQTEDCMCNWHCHFTSDDDMNTEMHRAVRALDTEMSDLGLWCYGERPSHEQIALFGDVRSRDEDMPTDSYCINCSRSHRVYRGSHQHEGKE